MKFVDHCSDSAIIAYFKPQLKRCTREKILTNT